ncbi:hypothetical protein [Paracoccus everestensis]|nr:hypothetical protein [Paracoccus everestensis]
MAARKPAPDVYLLALHRLGIVPSGCIAMEDSPPCLRTSGRSARSGYTL